MTTSETVPPGEMPRFGSLLGVDPGQKRIGLAVSNDEQTLAVPLEVRQRQGDTADAAYFRRIIDDYRIVGIVLGLPVHLSGDEGTQAWHSRKFGQMLAAAVERPIVFWDERFTSHAADALLFQQELTNKRHKARRDMLAAQILLQSYLDAPDRLATPADVRR